MIILLLYNWTLDVETVNQKDIILLIMFFLLALAIDVLIANIIGKIGKEKTIGYVKSFWLSIFLTPVMAILIVIASRAIPKNEEKQIGISKIIIICWAYIGIFILLAIIGSVKMFLAYLRD